MSETAADEEKQNECTCFGWRLFGNSNKVGPLFTTDDGGGNKNSKDADNDDGIVVVEVQKPTVDSYIGLSLRKYKNLGVIRIQKIADNGLFANTELEPGQTLVSINNIACPVEDLQSTIDLLKRAPAGTLRLETYKHNNPTMVPTTPTSGSK